MKKGIFFSILLIVGCKASYDIIPYQNKNIPKALNYSNDSSWAVLPQKYPKQINSFLSDTIENRIDIFYVYPTLLTDKKNIQWNAKINDQEVQQEILNTPIKYQATAWLAAGNLYVPFYRQAHYKSFFSEYKQGGQEALLLAYSDVKRAFQYYLDHFNKGKPIILAGHSQGSFHLKHILKDFFVNKPLQKKLIVAYLAGIKVLSDEFEDIKPMYAPQQVGGFVSWNTYKKNNLPKTYTRWYQGGVTINPITWDNSELVDAEKHLGLLNRDLKIYPKSVSLTKIDGMLWSTVPKIPKRFWLSFIKDYHFADINLYWADIQENAKVRAAHWLKLNALNQ